MPATRRRSNRGASAVEFALVVPVLFLLVFGILQYGLWFNDSLSTRQGVRDGARMGAIGDFRLEGACSGPELTTIACRTVDRIGALTGTAYVMVSADTWAKGEPLTVCALVQAETIGVLPMPRDGWIASKTQMSIEKAEPAPATLVGTAGVLPAGAPAWPAGCE